MQAAHDWCPSVNEIKQVSNIEEAISIQDRIKPLVQIPADEIGTDEQGSWWLASKYMIALDIAYSTRSNLAVASGVLYRIDHCYQNGKIIHQERKIVERVSRGQAATFPYQAGLLAFREIPLLTTVLEELLVLVKANRVEEKEDGGDIEDNEKVVLLCDGAGIAHPRFCGLACHLGVLYQCASIGVAKNHLNGEYNGESLGSSRSSYVPLYIQDRIVGSVLRSQDCIRPIFVSPGHLISIDQAREVVLYSCHRYRLPEPIRRADHIGRMELKRLEKEEGDKEEKGDAEFRKRVAKPKSKSIIHGQRSKQQDN